MHRGVVVTRRIAVCCIPGSVRPSKIPLPLIIRVAPRESNPAPTLPLPLLFLFIPCPPLFFHFFLVSLSLLCRSLSQYFSRPPPPTPSRRPPRARHPLSFRMAGRADGSCGGGKVCHTGAALSSGQCAYAREKVKKIAEGERRRNSGGRGESYLGRMDLLDNMERSKVSRLPMSGKGAHSS
jgi:hypothetical protein